MAVDIAGLSYSVSPILCLQHQGGGPINLPKHHSRGSSKSPTKASWSDAQNSNLYFISFLKFFNKYVPVLNWGVAIYPDEFHLFFLTDYLRCI